MKEYPNWGEMPDDLMVNVFQRLPTVQVLNSARKVCKSWWRICKYPAMWKVISMPRGSVDRRSRALTMEAVDLSCGELIDISIDSFGTDDLLHHITLPSKKLKRLRLVNCLSISSKALSVAVKSVPQLEELQLSCSHINEQCLECIGRNCPHLRSFEMTNMIGQTYDDDVLAIANNMPELRRLNLRDNNMTNDGLEAILNGCPHLESLDVRNCRNLNLDGNLGKVCMERIKDFKHGSTRYCGFYDVVNFSGENIDDDFFEEHLDDDSSEEHLDDDSSEEHLDDDFSEEHLDDDFSKENMDDDLSEEHLDDDFSEEPLDDDFAKENMDDDLSEEHLDDDFSEEHLDDDFSKENMDDDLSEEHLDDDFSEEPLDDNFAKENVDDDLSEEHLDDDFSEENTDDDDFCEENMDDDDFEEKAEDDDFEENTDDDFDSED